MRAKEIQRLEKLLEDAGIKLSSVAITMDSGLVLTRHPAMSDSCPRSFADWDGAVEIQVTTDARAVFVGCLLKD